MFVCVSKKMEMIWHQAPAKYIASRYNIFSQLFEKINIVVALEKYLSLLIATIVNVIDGFRLKIHLMKIQKLASKARRQTL